MEHYNAHFGHYFCLVERTTSPLIKTEKLIYPASSSSSSIFGPAIPQFLDEFHSDSGTVATFTISEYAAGYILGPLVAAPLSELYGRTPVIHASNVLFLVFTVACAVSSDVPMFIVFRLGQAFCVCGAGTLGPGFIADLMRVESRGLAMTIFAVGPTIGPSLSPTIGGILAQKAGWRWVFWFTAILAGILSILAAFVLKETYQPMILARREARTRRASGNNPTRTPLSAIGAATVRPVKLLVRSPVTLILALQSSIALSYLNLVLSTFALIFQSEYQFTAWQSGFTLYGLGIGFIIGQIAVGSFSDSWLKRQKSRRNETLPEDRLPPLLIGSILIPAGFFWYGWAIESHTHWIIPIIGSFLVSVGAMFCFLPVSLYLVDAYTVFAASATAGNLMVRSIVSAVIPLAAEPLYRSVGYGWGSSIFAFVALGFLPVPFFLVRYGHFLRTHPRFQVEL
jgi:multidrug resistance protein